MAAKHFSARHFPAIIVAFLLFSLISDSFFILNPMQQALILQFKEPKGTVSQPGLHLKLPYVQTVVLLDSRVLPLEPPEQEAILADQKRLVVDAFARYRITDPLKFIQHLRSEQEATEQLSSLINSSMRQVLGTVTMRDVLSDARAKIMTRISAEVNQKAAESDYGVAVVDVRIRRADLPPETSQAIFDRMRSERQKEAAEIRATGLQQAQEIRAGAERDRTILLAEATRQAQTTKGEGDEQALTLLAAATSKDPQFYSFFRSLQAYRTALATKETTLVLSPESDFFRYFMRGALH